MDLNKKLQDKPAFQLLYYTKQSITILEKSQKLPENGQIEVLIFNSVYVKKIINQTIEYRIAINMLEYEIFYHKYLKELGLESKVNNFMDFIKEREVFYSDEIEAIENNEYNLLNRIYYLFYENPLSGELISTNDHTKIMHFLIGLKHMIEFLQEIVEKIGQDNFNSFLEKNK